MSLTVLGWRRGYSRQCKCGHFSYFSLPKWEPLFIEKSLCYSFTYLFTFFRKIYCVNLFFPLSFSPFFILFLFLFLSCLFLFTSDGKPTSNLRRNVNNSSNKILKRGFPMRFISYEYFLFYKSIIWCVGYAIADIMETIWRFANPKRKDGRKMYKKYKNCKYDDNLRKILFEINACSTRK